MSDWIDSGGLGVDVLVVGGLDVYAGYRISDRDSITLWIGEDWPYAYEDLETVYHKGFYEVLRTDAGDRDVELVLRVHALRDRSDVYVEVVVRDLVTGLSFDASEVELRDGCDVYLVSMDVGAGLSGVIEVRVFRD